MTGENAPLNRPIRVVVFGGGPALERGTVKFICLLDDHPEIAFLGAFCQSPGQTIRAIFQDLWRRRGLLAVPLFVLRYSRECGIYLAQPQREIRLARRFKKLSELIRFVPDIHAEEVQESVRNLKPDLGLIYGSPILKPSLFEIPSLGTLGIHHGKVPEYRGKKTTFWALYNGEKTAGVTIQRVNAGLDTGEIVETGEVRIGRRSHRKIWNDLEQLGLELYIAAILAVRNGTARYRPQEGKKGRLYRDPGIRELLSYFRRRTQHYLRD